MAERSVTAGDVRLVADDGGEGPPVVLLHGLTATRHYVVMGSKALERAGHRVVAYDARGHGRSSPAPDPSAYGYDALAADLGAVLDELDLDRVVLAGASMGAHTALRFALDHPDRVAGLVAITPAWLPGGEGTNLERWDALAEGLRGGGVDGFVEAYDVGSAPERWRNTIEQVLRQRLSRHEHPDAVADALQAVPRSEPLGALGDLERLRLPAVVVASRDEADPGHPQEVAERYARHIPGAHVEIERRGRSPLAWQGGQLSKVIAALAAEAFGGRRGAAA